MLLEIVHLLDKTIAGLGDSDSDGFHDSFSDALDEIYEETYHLEFWDYNDADMELDRLLKTRYSQFFLQ